MKVSLLPPLVEQLVRRKEIRLVTPAQRSSGPAILSILILSGDLITQVDGEFWRSSSNPERAATIAEHCAGLQSLTSRLGGELTDMQRRIERLSYLLAASFVGATLFQYLAVSGEGLFQLWKDMVAALWFPALLSLLPILAHRLIQRQVRAMLDGPG